MTPQRLRRIGTTAPTYQSVHIDALPLPNAIPHPV